MSDKQKRISLQARRGVKREKVIAAQARAARQRRVEELKAALDRGEVLVDRSRLTAGYYDSSEFILRGTYRPVEFTCRGCGKVETWTPQQQKWWYETAKGNINSTATMCRPCRRKQRERRSEARRVHLEGIARKRAQKA
jgi:hypothetical protein